MKKNKYPIYIVSKGRAHNMLTPKALDRLGLDYKIIIERQEFQEYSQNIDVSKILILPYSYIEEYDTCDDLGLSVSTGPGAARNFAWQHSIDQGYEKHWVLDDNLDDFHRLNRNIKVPVRTGATFRAAEDFTDRYENVLISGFNYYSFCKSTDAVPAFIPNTRIYSCLLIKNNIPYRWRGRYNEDTDLSLRVLKDGFCTIQFNTFLCGKVTTQRMRGGNSKEFYDKEGTYNKSKMLEDLHPDVAKVVYKFNRWHHQVDYRPFAKNKLQLKSDLNIPNRINNYGMVLTELKETDKR
ncbi:MAG: hypothetical protein KDH96_01375 [Candidatus Riesia sp.]|nr:hypothetical protein [Candidatus Riesia sp.]